MIQIGQRIYSILYGGRHGVVYAIHGEQQPQTIRTMGGVVATGGRAEFDIVFDNGTESKRLPECILHGVQWKIFDEVALAPEIKLMLDFASREYVRKAAEAQKKADEFQAAVVALRADAEYGYLQQVTPDSRPSGAKLVANNLRRQLKKAFPCVKFSVTMDAYDSVRIVWTDGPAPKTVSEIGDKYRAGSFDGMNDIFEYSRSPWTAVFGGVKYVTVTRSHSVGALTAAVAAVCYDHGWTPVEVKTRSDGTAWVNLGDADQDRVLKDYLAGRDQTCLAAA